jgi:hypothetical protein
MKLNSIVKFINDSWAESLASTKFAGIKMMGVTSQIPVLNDEGLETYRIAEFDERGQVVNDSAAMNESYSCLIYHRLWNTNNTLNKDSFGDDEGQKRTFYMSVFVYVNKSQLGIEASDMEMILTSYMPQSIGSDLLTGKFAGVSSCNITPTGSDFNQSNLFAREFNKKNYTMEPRIVLFELKYLIECTYSRNCINVLCCP